jgi:hypothetical protein
MLKIRCLILIIKALNQCCQAYKIIFQGLTNNLILKH